MSDELAHLDATATAERIRAGDLTPREAVDAAIARIERLDPELNTVVWRLFEKAQEAAADPPDGPFRGVPFLLKDLDGLSAGDPYGGGMKVMRESGWRPDESGYLVDKFTAAGLVTLGRTNVPELGLNITTEPLACGPSRNPWNPAHSTGGSSGGSAAAVAAGLVPAAHANDGGGSIRIPASECGLVGLKPTRGRVSLGPSRGEDWSGLTHDHVVTRSVRDSAAILDAVSGPMPGDPYHAPPPARPFLAEVGCDPGPLRVGLMTKAPEGAAPCHAECSAAVEATGRRLESLGHRVDVAHPAALDEHAWFQEQFAAVVSSWTHKNLLHWGAVLGRSLGPDDVEPGTWALANQGARIPASTLLMVLEDLSRWTRRMAGWWADGFDLLVTPTLAAPPPPIGLLGGPTPDPQAQTELVLALMCFTPQYNVTGQPAISLPLAWSESGLPLGVQLVAASTREDLLIRTASQLEQAHPWRDRTPPIFA